MQRRRLKALEIRGGASVGGLADARLEAQEFVAAAAQGRVDVDLRRHVEHVGVGVGAGDDDGVPEIDLHVASVGAQGDGKGVASDDRPCGFGRRSQATASAKTVTESASFPLKPVPELMVPQ